MRRIRPTKTYTVREIAAALGRDEATVRRWLRTGLPTIDGRKPPLVFGADLRDWLKSQWENRARKCKAHELFCFKCRAPRTPSPGSVSIHHRNEKTLAIKASCHVCGSRMNKVGSRQRWREIEAQFAALSQGTQHLFEYDNTGVNARNGRCDRRKGKPKVEEGQTAMDFGPYSIGSQTQSDESGLGDL